MWCEREAATPGTDGMDIKLTPEEKTLVDHAQEAVVRYNKIRHANGGIDTLYAFLLSNSGKMHDGACFEPNLRHATICGERHAIATMILQESYAAKIKSIVIADPVPDIQESSTPPCGTCRHLIWTHGLAETSVILLQYVQGLHGWTFPKIEKYLASDFYPYPFKPVEGLWDNFHPE